jgi:heme/copper-type cytochrome/quinol oxidase subunit 3
VWLLSLIEGNGPHGLEPVALYWHFVDVVWIVIFAIVYVRPFV